MLERRTLFVLLAFLTLYAMAFVTRMLWEGIAESPVGFVMMLPHLTAGALHAAGVPGVLEHGGLCGWGWCTPTKVGWIMVASIWLVSTWVLSFALSRLWRRVVG